MIKMAKETHEFQAETKQLLDLMIHSIYTNREIFLRELISNASDAIDKLHFESLTNRDILEGSDAYEIFLVPDKESKTLTISDNGIGMSRAEVVENIGTIAKSGTKAFMEQLAKAKEDSGGTPDKDLIGQFGVGFYSAFMVADKVTIVTKKAGETQATRWESAGDGSYTLHLADGDVTVTSEDVEVTVAQQEGYNCQSYGGVTVALETTLTEELLEEGFVREIISKVQTMRKECGLEVTDHIALDLSGNAKLTEIAAKNEEFIRTVTLADSVSYDAPAGTSKDWNINGEKLTLSIA